MINKVDGNSYYDYTKPKTVNIPDTGEKFSLGGQKDELTSELKDKKEKEVSDQDKQQAAERSGVRIELSSKGMEKQKQAEAMKSPDISGLAAWLDTIRTFLTTTVAAIKDIFDKIWNDPKPEDAAQDTTETAYASDAMEGAETEGIIKVTEIVDTADAAGSGDNMGDAAAFSQTDAARQDREIRQHLKNGDMNQVIRLLTDNGRKTVARNSSLLTCYDKNGRVVELDASVRERTLYGDRHARKL